jgi:hypothetical protein
VLVTYVSERRGEQDTSVWGLGRDVADGEGEKSGRDELHSKKD